jgi:hypothetical protein
MFSFGARYEWVTAAFLVGFIAPLPFYIMHRTVSSRNSEFGRT